MNLFAISLVFFVAHLSLFQETVSKDVDHEFNFAQQLRSYEIIAPRLQTHGRWKKDTTTQTRSGDHLGRAIFYLRGFGKDFVLDVAQNRVLLSANYVSRYFDEDGNEVIGKHKKNENCFYQGTVQGCQHSVVAISTCQGIDGMIYDGNDTYYVHPLPGNADKHIMYRSEDMIHGDKRCGVEHSNSAPVMDQLISHGKHRARRSVESETKFVELVIVNDQSQYLDLSKNTASVEHRSKTIANIVDSLYRPLNIRIALTMVEIWTDSDKIVVDEDSDKCLDNFMQYRNNVLYKNFKHDNAMLVVHRSFKGSTVGKAGVSAMCGRKSGGVVQDHSSSAASTAATLAHEMGHNFAMLHDEDFEGCKCNAAKDQGCIMSSVAKHKPSTEWSSCSQESYQKYLTRGLDACLFNTPPTLFGDAVCGNGFKEEGEECDCGTVEECKTYGEGCCNATTCKLYPGSDCDTGPCCGGCKFKAEGSLCRDKVTECDLPEFCTGKSELCPSNKYVRDGAPCADNKGYCYNSECPLHDVQCQDLWGPDAKSGPDGCYKMNERGTVRGNCHQPGNNVYEPCAAQDKLCGMLQCTNIDDINFPIIGAERSTYPHYYGSTLCKSTSVSLALDVSDPGETVVGTKCGENKLCVDRKCTDITTFTSGLKRCPNNCTNGNGICNNEGDCFCFSCWVGPDCSTWVECKSGEGTKEPQTAKRSILAGILISVFLGIFLVIGAVCAIIYRKQLMRKWRASQQKAPGPKRYQGVSTGSPKQSRAHNGAGTHTKTDVEAPKPRPNISGPTLTSTTRNETDVNIISNPLGSTKFSNEPAKQDQWTSQPRVALKPTPPKPEKPAVEKQETTPKYPPAKLREWPSKVDKKASLNRVSSPPTVGEPVKPVKPVPVKPRRPESHAGILDKPAVPRPPAKKPPTQGSACGQEKSTTDKPKAPGSQPKVPRRPSEDRPSSLPLKPSDIKKAGLAAGNKKPSSFSKADNKPAPRNQPKVPPPAGGIDAKFPKRPSEERPSSLPLKPSDIKIAGLAADSKKPSSFSAADNKPAPRSQPKVSSRPLAGGIDARRFPTRPSEERPSSLPLKPSDIKKAGLAASNKKPSSFSTADNKPKKVPLKPPGPVPPRPGSKPT